MTIKQWKKKIKKQISTSTTDYLFDRKWSEQNQFLALLTMWKLAKYSEPEKGIYCFSIK